MKKFRWLFGQIPIILLALTYKKLQHEKNVDAIFLYKYNFFSLSEIFIFLRSTLNDLAVTFRVKVE